MRTIFTSFFCFAAVCVFLAAQAGAIETKAKQAILVDDTTNTVLFQKDAETLMHPSSMSKLMTLYVLFKHLKEGGLQLTDQFSVSEKAWRTQGSKSFVAIGSTIAIEDLIRGIIIQSGNDACIVVAEGLAGSEEAFAQEMNKTAKEIGLLHSNFDNATGLPDEKHLMSAYDLALLAHHVIHDFPEYYHYFAELEFTHNNITQHNRNTLLHSNIGVDGLKTGHTEAGGYGITVSALQNGRRLIAVVNGLGSENERAAEAENLIRAGFRDYEIKTLVAKNQPVGEAEVWYGAAPTVKLAAAEDIILTLPRMDKTTARLTIRYNGPLAAPVPKGSHVADLVAEIPGAPPKTVALLAAEDVEQLRFWQRIVPNLMHLFGRP